MAVDQLSCSGFCQNFEQHEQISLFSLLQHGLGSIFALVYPFGKWQYGSPQHLIESLREYIFVLNAFSQDDILLFSGVEHGCGTFYNGPQVNFASYQEYLRESFVFSTLKKWICSSNSSSSLPFLELDILLINRKLCKQGIEAKNEHVRYHQKFKILPFSLTHSTNSSIDDVFTHSLYT